MKALLKLSALPLIHHLGWTLLHFLWQGTLVALLLACVLGSIRSQESRLRYLIACAGLAIMVALSITTFVIQSRTTHTQAATQLVIGPFTGLTSSVPALWWNH